MKRMNGLCLWICVLLSAPAFSGELRMGVVNIQRIFQQYKRVQDGQDKLRAEFGPEETAMEKTEVELRKMKDRLEVDPRPKTDLNFYQDFQKLQFMTLEHENRKRTLMQRVAEKQREEMRTLLTELRNAVRVVAASEGVHFVMRAPEWDDNMGGPNSFVGAGTEEKDKDKESKEPKSAQMLVGLFRENPLMHYTPSMDITDKVVKMMNDEYAARKK